MAKINPFFEVEGKKYEIKRTRAIECEYEKIRRQNQPDDEQLSLSNDYAKLMLEYEEILEKYKLAKEEYFDDVLNKEKKDKYNAFKELADEKYNEMKEFELNNKNFSFDKLQDIAYNNGVELLMFGLEEQCNVSNEEARNIWEKFVDNLGIYTAKDWINAMVQTLFEREDEEENPFLKIAKAKAQQRMEQRRGLSKMKR